MNVITQTRGVIYGEMTGNYTGLNVARVHSETGLITGTIIVTGVFTYREVGSHRVARDSDRHRSRPHR
jgi:hypothetical protein